MAERSEALAVKFLKKSPYIFDFKELNNLLYKSGEIQACIVNNPILAAKIPYRFDAKEKSDSNLGEDFNPNSWVDLMRRSKSLATMMVKNQCRWFLDQLCTSEVQVLIARYPC